MTTQDILNKVIDKNNLSSSEAEFMMNAIMEGSTTPIQTAGFLVGLRSKGETSEEVTSFARVMRNKATRISTSRQNLVDTCGTGGDAAQTFNISTAAAFVVAGAGVPVAKHGNRSVSSNSGSADVLQELGVRIDLPPDRVGGCIDEVGMGFLFAQLLHQAMKHAAPVRRELGVRTVFNILGPLTNPAGAQAQVVGVYAPELTKLFAQVLANLGSQRALVVHGDGLDEITLSGITQVSEVHNGVIKNYTIAPENFGMARVPIKDLQVSSPQESAGVIRHVLDGALSSHRNIVVLNAAAGILAGEKASDFKSAITLAEESIDSGKAKEKLNQLVEYTNRI